VDKKLVPVLMKISGQQVSNNVLCTTFCDYNKKLLETDTTAMLISKLTQALSF
jgi:hypothetical protein